VGTEEIKPSPVGGDTKNFSDRKPSDRRGSKAEWRDPDTLSRAMPHQGVRTRKGSCARHCFEDINRCLETILKDMHTDEPLTDLKNAILRAFPDVVFEGKIAPHDGEWPDEVTEETAIYEGQVIYGDEMLLYEALKGHKWSDIPREFIQGMAIDFVLLTSEALIAFIAAWLMRSLENLTGKNDVRRDFISMFSPDREESKELTIDLLRAFNPKQLAVLRLFFVEFSKSEPLSLFEKTLTMRQNLSIV
jgi:hypothetical protein